MQLSSQARKAMAAGLAASTLLLGVAGLVPSIASAAVHSDGCVVLSGGIVWLITGGTRRGFTSADVFQSSGYNFSQVVTATAEDAALPVGPIMTYADGTLVKGPNDPLVYLVTGGQKRPFVSGSVFTGRGYSFANIQQAPANTFADLPTGANLDNTTDRHGTGVLVISNGTLWMMTSAGRQGFPSMAVFNSYGLMLSHAVAANAADLSATDMGPLAARAGCTGGGTTPTPTPTPTPVPTGSMSVSLASDNPASRAVVTTEGQADLAHFTFMGNAVVNNVTLKRVGVSADASLANVYLFDGATRITDASSVSSGSLITFNSAAGLFTVNGSKTISVRSDMAANAGETVGIQLVSAMAGTVAFTGTPVTGNTFTIATATLATVALSVPTGSGASDPGLGINVWQGTATVGTRDVLMTRLALRQIGSINNNTDINNFKLWVDGAQVAQTQSLDSNGYVTFNASVPLKAGARILKVTADLIGGSSRTVQLSLRGAYDMSVTDTQYNAGVKATGTFPFGPSSFTVNSGSMTVVKTSDSQSANVTVGASNQSLGKFTFSAFGEPIKVQTLNVGMIVNGTPAQVTIRNVALYVNGSQVGSTTNVPAAASYAGASGTQFTTNFTVVPGTPNTIEIRGDMVDSNTTGGDDIAAAATTTVQAVLIGGSGTQLSNGTPQVSLTPFDVPNTANVLGNNLTIASGSLSIAKTASYGNQTVVAPATAYKIASFVVTGNATEAVNLNTIYVGWTTNSSSAEQTDLSNLYVTYGTVSTSPKGTVVGTTGTTVSTNSNSWSINQTLAVNQTMQFDVYANVASSLSTNVIQAALSVAGTTAQSGIAVYADSNSANTTLDAGFSGQTITGGSGSIVASTDASTPNAAIVPATGTVTTAAFKFAASNDSYTITDLTVTLGDASAVSTVNLMDGTTQIASLPANATVAFHGLTTAVAANVNKVLTVQLVMSGAGVGVGAGATGGALTTTLTAATVRSSGGTNSSPTGMPAAGNAIYVYKSIPTITNVALPTTVLSNGTVTLAKITIASNGGTISWNKLLFTVSKNIASAADAITAPTLWDVTSGATQVTAAGSFVTTLGGANTSGSITILPNVEQQISGSKTYELRATLGGGAVATNDSIVTNITQPSSFAASGTAFKANAASGLSYYDFAGAPTAVTVNDVRMNTISSVVAAQDTTTVMSTAVNNVRDSYGLTNASENGKTVSMTSNASNQFVSLGGTLCSATGWTCLAKTAADGGGSTVATLAANNTVLSIVASATGKQVIFNVTGAATPGAATSTITLTVTDGAYAIGSSVAANNSDLNLVTVAGVATAASLVWSDVSAASHGVTTSDWASGYLVQNLPTATQALTK
jgi:hypothetical protein